jgi:hypothetical protein
MTDLEEAKRLFRKAGLAFPTIPEELGARLKKRGEWLFSTRKIDMSPYNLDHYVIEINKKRVKDYAVICHSGHGVNSYAVQYYLVYGPLRLFLHLGWGGVYSDAKADAAKIKTCFSMADEITRAVQSDGTLGARDQLTIICSDFYGSYWLAPGESRPKEKIHGSKGPAKVLTEVRYWLKHLK